MATVVDGLNATLMAYGQTGSGKTHAMFGPDEVVSNFSESEPVMHGMIPRSIKQIFEALEALAPEDESKYSVQCSFLELCEWPPSEPLQSPWEPPAVADRRPPRAVSDHSTHRTPACLLRASDLSHINDLLGGEQRERDGRTIAPDRQLREGKAGVFVEHLTRRNETYIDRSRWG